MLFWLTLAAVVPASQTTAPPVRSGGVQAMGTARVRIVPGVRITQAEAANRGARVTHGIVNFQ